MGDIVLLTGAVRDLQLAYPNQFQIEVQTTCPELWWANPYIQPRDENEAGAEIIPCTIPLVSAANQLPAHVLHGFPDFLSARLGHPIAPLEFRGDIHLSKRELAANSPIIPFVGKTAPYWLILGGGKHDITIKWWSHSRYQSVVDHFRGRLLFAQLGRIGDHHPRLNGTLDLRGRTSLRELVQWVRHAQGVVCGVTGLMHLAAAVPRVDPSQGVLPCVIVAGGREPVQWESYPGHQFLHTIGALDCCATGGCWRSRTKPLRDGSPHDDPARLCVDVRGGLPRCMKMIGAQDVIAHIERVVKGRRLAELTQRTYNTVHARIQSRGVSEFDRIQQDFAAAPTEAERFLMSIPSYPKGRFRGRGIVMCAGGKDLFTNAWASLHLLREQGCQLPAELWHAGPEELDDRMRKLIEPLGVSCIDATRVGPGYQHVKLFRFAIKAYSVLHSSFREILFLDADNLVARDPTDLFEAPHYLQTGAVFWPDGGHLSPDEPIWRACKVVYRREPEFETGQMLIDKRQSWRPLNLAWHYNERCDLYYRLIHGDKDTFHMAWRKAGAAYAMPAKAMRFVSRAMVQHDLSGRRVFEHLARCKFTYDGNHPELEGIESHASARNHVAALKQLWNGQIAPSSS